MQISSILFFVALIVSLLLNFAQLILNQREKKDLFNRFMSKDYQEYKYFDKDFPVEVKHKEEMLRKERKDTPELTPIDREKQRKAEGL